MLLEAICAKERATLPPSDRLRATPVTRLGASLTAVTAKALTVRAAGVPVLLTSVAVSTICGAKPVVELFWCSVGV